MSCAKLVRAMHHVGWVVPSRERFEKFWCDILGFELCHEGTLSEAKTYELFKRRLSAKVYRYRRDDFNLEIEIHVFSDAEDYGLNNYLEYLKLKNDVGVGLFDFTVLGINHICLTVEDRDQFLADLPEDIKRHIYDDPRGWQNVFIKDYDSNWIELRTPPKE